MTTPPEIVVFRTRPDQPLVPGVDPAAIRAEVAAAGPVSLAEIAARRAAEAGDGAAAAARTRPPADAKADAPADAVADAPTARQLRIAGRIARRLGVPAADDAAAVTALRARGIDPFDRTALIGGPQAAQATAGTPARAPRTGALSATSEPGAQATGGGDLAIAAQEVGAIQRDIARRRRNRMLALALRLALFVALPTAATWAYATHIATQRFETLSEFVIQQAEGRSAEAGMFQSAAPVVQQDSITVQAFLHSRAAMLRLDAEHGFRAHFGGVGIDPLHRLGAEATDEAAYRLYRRMVKVAFDPTEGLLRMSVQAASPRASQTFSEALIGYAEEQVDRLTRRMRAGQMAGAEAAYAAAEARMRQAQAEVLRLQQELGVLDPASETGSLMAQITEFEVLLRQRRLQLDQLTSVPAPNAARVAALEGEIARLREMIADMRATMTEGRGTSLASVTGRLRVAEAELATRQELLKQAAGQLEAARIEADRQVRYMAVGVAPIAPDEPTAPRVAAQTGLAFALCVGLYLLGSLTVSVLREQVTA